MPLKSIHLFRATVPEKAWHYLGCEPVSLCTWLAKVKIWNQLCWKLISEMQVRNTSESETVQAGITSRRKKHSLKILSLPVTTKALLALMRFIMRFRAAAAKTAKLSFKYQKQNLWKFMKRCLNFTIICIVMKNAFLEQFKTFISLDIFSATKIFSTLKK